MPEDHAPPVVAVVVTRNAGPFLEQCLASLGRQDYANLDVLVVDDASASDPTSRVAAELPRAVMRRRAAEGGFARCANDALEGIEGAAFFLICHDDVVLADDAVRLLVAEAFRSNAGVVGPKFVAFENPRQLLQIGLAVDRFGSAQPRVATGELDQAQHDEVREVFAVPAGCQLVRVDLFAALGGMDDTMGAAGQDVDVCWRAQVAGARVVVAPQAVVRHLDASRVGERVGEAPNVSARDELRAVLKNYGLFHRIAAVVAMLLAGGVGFVGSLGSTRRHGGARNSGRWRWNVANRHSLHGARVAVHESRAVPDSEITDAMARRHHRRHLTRRAEHGASGSTVAYRDLARGGPERAAAGHRLADGRPGGSEAPTATRPGSGVAAAVVLGVVVLLGIRGLLLGHLPVVGDLLPMPAGSRMLQDYLGGLSNPGWHSSSVAPPAYGIVGLAGLVAGNSTALVVKALLFAGIVIGAIGAARLVGDFGGSKVRVAAAIGIIASPIAWNALGHGDIQAAVALASTPFIIRRLAVASRLKPFAASGDDRSVAGWGWLRQLAGEVAPLGLLLAVAISLAPAVLLDTATIVVAMLLASVVVGGIKGALRAAGVALAGCGVAFLCTLPWSLEWLHGASWSLFAGATGPPGGALRPASLLRGAVGSVGGSWVAWGLVAAAAFALVVARGARLRWAARWWVVILGSVAVAWAGSEGWLGSGGGDTLVLLAPSAAGLAACCGVGAAAFEVDLARSRFGWRQGLTAAAAVCFVAGLLPAAAVAAGGRGDLPSDGLDQVLGWMGAPTAGSSSVRAATSVSSRALWLGDPRALPGRPWSISPGLAAFATTSGLPGADAEWPSPRLGSASGVSAAITSAEKGQTVQLGAVLAPYGIRYLVVPAAPAPVIAGQQTPVQYPPPASLVGALQAQSDLRQLPAEGGITVFENADWTTTDGTGQLVASRGSSGNSSGSPEPSALDDLALAVALLVVAACVAEGMLRRRRLRHRRHRRALQLVEYQSGVPAIVSGTSSPESATSSTGEGAEVPVSTSITGSTAAATGSASAESDSPVLQGAD